ncbi:MATE family multidrug resistance protein [Luteimonas sp. J16]|uniref:MATE family efflux transporter n=1 Tax=unclassified Luteimonas TaxID=2629088 RepID=UPI000478D04D|nr:MULTISPECIES: MATE family efflux transporter [unclassified Luteimonas]TWG88387.1 MATE family multidrug resistance protein [Luteimonas sp. J16]
MSPPASPARLRDEVRTSAVLAAPLVAGHLATGLIGFVDNVIAGRHGTSTLAGVAVGTAMFWLVMLVPMGTLMALPPSVSQLDGAGRRAEVGPLFRQALWLALGLGLLLFVLLTLGRHVLEPMGIAPEVRPDAAAFLGGIRWGVPALTLYFCLRYLCDGLHWTLPTMAFGFGGLLVLLPLGYALTFGAFGLPEGGAGGLGLASAIMMWSQVAGFVLYLAWSPRFRDMRLFERLDPPRRREIGTLLRTGLPIGVTVAMEGGLFVVTALLIGRIGELEVAAHQIAINVSSLCFMVPFGLAEATTVRVGHAVGAGRGSSGVRRAALAGLVLVLGTQALSATALLGGHEAIATIYTHDMAVAALAGSLLLLAAAFQFPDGIQVLSAGALRGLKDTRVPMFIAALAYWGIGMPLGAGLGLGLGWGPRGMWLGLIAGLTVAAVLMAARFVRSSRPAALAAAPGTPVTNGA